MPDVLSLQSAIAKIDSETMPAAAKLANDVLTNAANLLDAALTKQDAVLGDAITVIDGCANRVVDKAIGELAAWRVQITRVADAVLLVAGFVDRISLLPKP
ncbi:MAG TPA: hypothetical protein VHC90_20030 [Bryobacteraceae bacterium]|nr:hypothetical protein [Bryobacteraceae bacterium]